MRRALASLLLGTALAALPACARAQASGDCAFLGETGVPAQRLAALARGFNLPGWLDGSATRRPDIGTLTALHRRGFTHVRLPVTPERLMAAFSAPADVARDRAELDAALDRLLAIGFSVSLDLHPGEPLSRRGSRPLRKGGRRATDAAQRAHRASRPVRAAGSACEESRALGGGLALLTFEL